MLAAVLMPRGTQSNFSTIYPASTAWRTVAVPSRLYSQPSTQYPLAGKRISVKDNFELAGMKIALSNKSYLATYDASNTTAEVVESLIAKGAIIVGKTKMCAFATVENPTDQWIDFQCPFNPRGGGYLHPGGSSTGAGAALAGYKWLDHSIGSDSKYLVLAILRSRPLIMSFSYWQCSISCSLQWPV